jgi:pyruvate kinase
MTTKKTKIVATIGPACDSRESIAMLIDRGVNVFRFNMKHADIAWHSERIKRVQAIADALKTPIGILIDLQGPEIRIETPGKADIAVKKGELVTFSAKYSDAGRVVCIPHPIVFRVLNVGDALLIDDGFLEFTVKKISGQTLVAEALDDCIIKHRKGMNIPGKKLDLPSLIEDDLRKLDMAQSHKVDFIALSFSRTKKDIEILRTEATKRKLNAKIVAKIESQQALDNLDDLIAAADAIMVARGDLGIEVPIEELAYWQKTIIAKCRAARKPVITATQMLQSMIDNPRPTRAEATDVANAIYDGTDAIMLSGETASGKFPVKAVEAMARIAKFNENKKTQAVMPIAQTPAQNSTELIVRAAISMLMNESVPIDALLVFTETGYTARALSSFRPQVPIIAVTDEKKTVETLTLSYSVQPIFEVFPSGIIASFDQVLSHLKKQKLIQPNQTILVIHGKRWKTPGLTNALTIVTV